MWDKNNDKKSQLYSLEWFLTLKFCSLSHSGEDYRLNSSSKCLIDVLFHINLGTYLPFSVSNSNFYLILPQFLRNIIFPKNTAFHNEFLHQDFPHSLLNVS